MSIKNKWYCLPSEIFNPCRLEIMVPLRPSDKGVSLWDSAGERVSQFYSPSVIERDTDEHRNESFPMEIFWLYSH